jgi:hypothetical protein
MSLALSEVTHGVARQLHGSHALTPPLLVTVEAINGTSIALVEHGARVAIERIDDAYE